MGTNCAPLLVDLFLYSYESEFLQKLVKNKKIDGPLISHTGILMTFYLYSRNRLLDKGYFKIRLIRSLKKFIFRYQDLVEI
jgi:hypothetical protein